MKPLIPNRLDQAFYKQDTITVAKKLLGKKLIKTNSNGKQLSGIIVETEAYFQEEPSCHAFCGHTKRTAPMFDEPGTSYVYFIYGMYNCVNVVTEPKGRGCAVLIRALEPLDGIEQMKENRNKQKLKELCSGPGKLTQALEITKKDNHLDLTTSNQLFIADTDITVPEKDIHTTTRVGIAKAKELPYRFYIKGSGFVSKP